MSITEFASLFQIYPQQLTQLQIRGIIPKRKRREHITSEYATAFIQWWEQCRGDIPTDAIPELKKYGLII
jgi:hypothetical protein